MSIKIATASVTLSPSKELRDGMDTYITNALNALYHDGKPKRKVTYAAMRSLFVRAVTKGMEEGAEQAVEAGFKAGFKEGHDCAEEQIKTSAKEVISAIKKMFADANTSAKKQ